MATKAMRVRAAAIRASPPRKSARCAHHITSHHITPHPNISHHISTYHTTSHHITSHHITSHHITSHHITSPVQLLSLMGQAEDIASWATMTDSLEAKDAEVSKLKRELNKITSKVCMDGERCVHHSTPCRRRRSSPSLRSAMLATTQPRWPCNAYRVRVTSIRGWSLSHRHHITSHHIASHHITSRVPDALKGVPIPKQKSAVCTIM